MSAGHPQSLARGGLGGALGLAVAAHTDPTGGLVLHERLRELGPVVDGDDAGLFYGAPALAFVLHLAPEGYPRALQQLDDVNTALTRRRLDRAHQRMDQQAPAAFAEYDVIRGLAGLGLLWLQRGTRPDLMADILKYLVRLTKPSTSRPGWWVWHGPDDPGAPGGHANNSLAHGIAGPLAVLALARRQGITVSGQGDALLRVLDHLDAGRRRDSTRCWWDRWDHEARTTPPPLSWCYGTPGLVRAQQLAALALGDRARQVELEQVLLQDLLAAGPEPVAGPGLCHGKAGLLRTCERVADDAIDPQPFRHHIERLRTQLLTRRDLTPGLLNGQDGIDLAISASSLPWDACLALI